MNFSKIKTEIKDRGFTFRKVCEELGITEAGLHQMIRKESMQVEILEKIANVLGVHVGYFFDEPIPEKKNVSTTNSPGKCERCEHLEELLKSRESEIETLKKLVNMYEGEAGRREAKAC